MDPRRRLTAPLVQQAERRRLRRLVGCSSFRICLVMFVLHH